MIFQVTWKGGGGWEVGGLDTGGGGGGSSFQFFHPNASIHRQ